MRPDAFGHRSFGASRGALGVGAFRESVSAASLAAGDPGGRFGHARVAGCALQLFSECAFAEIPALVSGQLRLTNFRMADDSLRGRGITAVSAFSRLCIARI